MNELMNQRKARGLSQAELAEASGISVRVIQNYEQGVRDLNRAGALTVYRLARALSCTMEDLLDTEAIERMA